MAFMHNLAKKGTECRGDESPLVTVVFCQSFSSGQKSPSEYSNVENNINCNIRKLGHYWQIAFVSPLHFSSFRPGISHQPSYFVFLLFHFTTNSCQEMTPLRLINYASICLVKIFRSVCTVLKVSFFCFHQYLCNNFQRNQNDHVFSVKKRVSLKKTDLLFQSQRGSTFTQLTQ